MVFTLNNLIIGTGIGVNIADSGIGINSNLSGSNFSASNNYFHNSLPTTISHNLNRSPYCITFLTTCSRYSGNSTFSGTSGFNDYYSVWNKSSPSTSNIYMEYNLSNYYGTITSVDSNNIYINWSPNIGTAVHTNSDCILNIFA